MPDHEIINGQNGFESDRIRKCIRDNLRAYNKEMLLREGATRESRGPQAMRILREVVREFSVVINKLDVLDIWVESATGTAKRANTASLLQRGNPLRGVGNNCNELMKRMLQIEIIAFLTTENDSSDGLVPTLPIEFVQLSAHIEQDFAAGFSADDKLAGMSLHRFGAFLKRSWRANDWIWGRLDAVKMLMLIVLTPEMIRGCYRYNRSAERVVEDIARAAFHDDLHLYETLAAGSLRDLVKRAVKDVERAVAGDDAPMSNLASLAAYGYQVAIAKEDVPWLACTIRDDRDDGGTGTQTAQFLNHFENRKGSPNGYDLLIDFANSGIGQEVLAEQMPSDLMIRTAATAAATAVTALSAEESGLAFARPATKAARGLVALPYWVLVALTGQGRIARSGASIALALGVSFAALSLVTDLPGIMGKLVPTFGIAALLTVFAYAALRTQSIVHGAALLGLFIPVISYAVLGGQPAENGVGTGVTRVAVIWVILLLVWVLVVSNFTSHSRSPSASVVRAARIGWAFVVENRRALIGAAVLGVGAGAIGSFGRHFFANWYRGSWTYRLATAVMRAFQHRPWDGDIRSWTTVAIAAVAVAGFLIAWLKSVRFRRSRWTDLPAQAPASDPAWLATAWSPVYGLIYLAIGVLLVPLVGAVAPRAEWQWARVASLVSLTVGLFFSWFVTSVVPRSREKRLIRRLVTHFEPESVPEAPTEIIAALDALGEFTGYLSKGGTSTRLTIEEGAPTRLTIGERKPRLLTIEKGEQGTPTRLTVEDIDPIRLTRHGKRVRRRARRMSERRARTYLRVGG